MNISLQHDRTEKLLQSIDFAVKQLLNTEDDPLALAMYLWVFRTHNMSLINSDRLASWGATWAYRVFVEGAIGRKKDEQIASAALATAALVGTSLLADIENDILVGVKQILSIELNRQGIPLGHPAYGAILLFAAYTLHIEDSRILQANSNIAEAYIRSMSRGQAFGIVFTLQLIQKMHIENLLTTFVQHIQDTIGNSEINYENQIYLLHALQSMHDGASQPVPMIDLAQRILTSSPIWSYLMVGIEDIPPAGDEQVPVPISHLYRAVLLSAAIGFHASETLRIEAQLEARYGGRRLINLSAFGFSMTLLAAMWFFLVRITYPSLNAGRQYWLLNQYSAMSSSSALLFLGGILLAILLFLVSLILIWTLWSLLVQSKAANDREIAEVLGRRIRAVFWAWLTIIVVAVIINLISGTIGSAFSHAIGGK